MNTTTKAPPVQAPYRDTCTVETYSAWLSVHNVHPVHYLSVLGRMVDLGGSWTVGTELLPWPYGKGMQPRPLLQRAVFSGHAVQVGPDTWQVTEAGRQLDAGRPHPIVVWVKP